MLKARIKKLEERTRARAATILVDDVDEASEAAKLAQFRSDLAILFYNTWRHAGLTLLQKLALARDDLRRTPDDRHVIRAVRELEIRIGLRDEKIDDETAWGLRANADQHFGLDNDRPLLLELPMSVEFDEAEALRTARMTCPRVETLPLERQLVMREEDHEHDLQERERRADRGLVDPSMDAVTDRIHELVVSELRQKIRDRDVKAGASVATIDQ